MKKIISILLFSIVAAAAAAQTSTGRNIPFKDGEGLRYTVSYKIGMVNTDVADVNFNTTATQHEKVDAYNVHAYSVTYPLYKSFFDINDHYNSILEASTLRPIMLTTELQEGRYRFSSRFLYDWDNMVVHTQFRNHKNPDYTKMTLEMTAKSFDALAFFYNFRSQDLASYKEGDSFIIHLVLEKSIRQISYRFEGREVIDLKGLGKFKTLKFTCQLATDEGVTFEDGSQLLIWISDDMNKIPIYMETPIRIGTIRVRLASFEGLKYPFYSMVNK